MSLTPPNSNQVEDDERGAALGPKLLAESSISADNQILIAGLAVVAAMAIGLGWNTWRNSSSSDEVVASVVENTPSSSGNDDTSNVGLVGLDTDTTEATIAVDVDETETAADITLPDQAALSSAAARFGITGRVDGTTAVLEGAVPTATDSTAAASAAAAVAGITAVDNRLTVVQDAVVASLTGAGVDAPAASMNGMIATVSGMVPTAADATAAVAAAAAVDGVTDVVDELTIAEDEAAAAAEAEAKAKADEEAARADEAAAAATDAEASLNALFELAPIEFATGSAVILDTSFGTLDQASTLLVEVGANFEVQGYTDTRGPDDANLALSQARADSVREYLVSKGVAPESLVAVGYGETTQFGEGADPAVLAANRRVQFAKS